MKWERVTIDSISKVVTKGTTPTTIGFNFAKQGIPFLRVQNIQNGVIDDNDILFINETTNKALSRSVIQPSDVLITIAGTIGRTAVVPINAPPMNCNQAVAIIRFGENVNPYYFSYWLNTKDAIEQITGSKVTATISNLSLGCIKELQVPLPPLEEQHRIAAILDKADAIRRKRFEAIRLTEELLRAAFLDMFGDPVTNPKGWEVKQLDTTFARKPQIGTIKPSHADGKYLVIRVGEIGEQNVDLNGCGRITLEGSDLEKFICKPGDLLLARAIGSESHLGKASILQDTTQVVVFDSHVMRLRFLPERLLPMFFLQWLKTPGGRTRFMKEAGRTAVQFNVNAQQISRVEIPLPPIALQEEFMNFYIRTINCLKNYDNGEKTIDNLFNSLLHRAFLGEL